MICAACETLGPETNSGDDKDRLGAIEIKINDLVLDHVTCIDGDKTDWKYFTVPGEGRIAVTFAFDEPAASGTVVIRKATVKRCIACGLSQVRATFRSSMPFQVTTISKSFAKRSNRSTRLKFRFPSRQFDSAR